MHYTSPRAIDVFSWFLLLCLGVFVFLFFFQPIETEDVWWHLSTGKWILEHMQVPRQDPFPFANEKTPWLCYHWLGSVLFYLSFKAGGLAAVKIFRAMFFVSVIAIFFSYIYKRLSFPLPIILVLLMAYGLSERILLRPDMLNFLFVQIFLIQLLVYEEQGGSRRLLVLPVLSMIWTNIHLGSLIYGISLISIFLFSACAGYVGLKAGGAPERALNYRLRIKHLTLTLVACLAASFLNPYGMDGFLFPFKVFLSPGFIDFYKVSDAIAESQPPAYLFLSFKYFYIHILLVAGLWTALLKKEKNFTLTITFFFSLFIFLLMARHVGFFILIASYVTAEGLKHIKIQVPRFLLTTGLISFLVFQTLTMCNEKVYFNHKHMRLLSVNDNIYLESLLRSLKQNGISGNVFNADLLGGFILWSDYPSMRPFLDGRYINKDKFASALTVFLDPQKNWPIAERICRFTTVIVPASSEYLKFIQYLNTRSDWQLIGVNGPIVAYVKRGEFHLSNEMDQIEPRVRSAVVSADDIKQYKDLTGRTRTVLRKLFDPSPVQVDLFTTGVTLINIGFTQAGVKDLIGALKVSDQPYMQKTAAYFLAQTDRAAVTHAVP